MTPLARLLAQRIRADGPLRLDAYMAECLVHPQHGYYTTRNPLGRSGDFTTAPEISQMFGELVGLALAQSWLDQGAPSPFTLAELGPGRGTLMADLWRATRGVPGFHAGARVVLVEVSPTLRAAQQAALPGVPVTWADDARALPDAPLWLVTNEFFDALPIRQFLRDPPGWREVMVGLTPDGTGLMRGLSPQAPHPALPDGTPPGAMFEVCPAALPVMAALQDRIARHGGAAVIVDYGGWGSRGDTFQAMAAHAPTDPFAAPGTADLTAHVDFRALAAAAPGLTASALTPQGAFLSALGIAARADRLARSLTGAARAAHLAALDRLTNPAQMGSLFQVLAFVRPGAPLPPGVSDGPGQGNGP